MNMLIMGEMEEDISNGLKKAKDKEPDKHLIKSNVIKINVTDFSGGEYKKKIQSLLRFL